MWDVDGEVLERWFQYIRRHAMGGVGMRAVRWERVQLGVGEKELRGVKGGKTPQAEMRRLAERIVREESGKVESPAIAS